MSESCVICINGCVGVDYSVSDNIATALKQRLVQELMVHKLAQFVTPSLYWNKTTHEAFQESLKQSLTIP